MAVVDPARTAVPERARAAGDGVHYAPILALWLAVVVALQGILWVTGFPQGALAEAVEQGAAHVESRGVGEVSDDLIRKAIQTQRDTLPFWTTLALIGDFLAEPLALVARVLAVATVFAASAALVGRPIRFERGLAECSTIQGIWVLGLVVRVVLMVALRRPDVETSLALFVPAGTYPAPAWLALRQLDPFALIGWAMLARGGWRRGQVNLVMAIVVCTVLGTVEAVARIGFGLAVGAGMRLDALPE